MTLFSKMRDGIQSITSSPQKLESQDSEPAVTERFRQSMLELAQAVPGDRASRLALRIRCAATLQSLWFMRSDVMALLAPAFGEVEARHRLDAISTFVRDMLPSGLRSRPSPLGRD
jgi:hypothetical protein